MGRTLAEAVSEAQNSPRVVCFNYHDDSDKIFWIAGCKGYVVVDENSFDAIFGLASYLRNALEEAQDKEARRVTKLEEFEKTDDRGNK